MLWVKSSPIGVLFPIVIAMLAPLRFGLEKFGIIKKDHYLHDIRIFTIIYNYNVDEGF